MAALLNGSMAQALEMDDKHGSSLARPGSTVIPAVLSVGEAADKTLEQVIAATVAGYEVMIRLGFVGGDRFLARGYHTSSLLGPFGSAIAIGNLTGSDAGTIMDALGIAGTFASGIQESTRTGSTSKILHGGWGAHAGIIANDLARAGITGPDTVFEGKFGFFETHLTPIEGDLNFAAVGDGLGQKWYTPDTAFKPYPCCQLLHAFIEAVKHILPQMAADGLGIADITAISCKLAEPGLTLVTQPLERKKRPRTAHEARFSLPFGVAAALVDGDVGLKTFQKERLGDENILRLAAMVEASVDPDSDYPAHCPAILDVTAGGKTYHKHVPHHPGCPEAPLSREDVLDKFVRNTQWLYGAAARDVAIAVEGAGRKDAFSTVIAGVVAGRSKGA
jgi:2-methylcitrate dehydratase PrpD